MKQPDIRRLPIWSKTLRICHWSMAASILTLMLTGWLIAWVPEKAESLKDVHFVAAAILITAIVIRLWLLVFGQKNDSIQSLLPNKHQMRQGWQVLRAYITLGKIPLPKWYAHNPLWAPIYLVVYALLLLQICTGLLLLNDITLLGSWSLRQSHLLGFQIISLFTLLHIAASFFHDTKGDGCDISAMINGQRSFTVESGNNTRSEDAPSISLSSLKIKKNQP